MNSRRPLSQLMVSISLAIFDVVSLLALFNLAYWVRLDTWIGLREVTIYGPIGITLLVLYVTNSYQGTVNGSSMVNAFYVGLAVIVSGLAIAIVVYLGGFGLKEPIFNRGIMPVALLLFVPWAAVGRYYIWEWIKKRTGKIFWIVVGLGERANLLKRDFQNTGQGGELVFTDETGTVRKDVDCDIEQAANLNPAGIVLAMDNVPSDNLLTKLMHLRLKGIYIYDLGDFYETHLLKVPVFHLRQGWFVLSQGFQLLHNAAWLKVKSIVDVVLAAVILILALPILIVAALLIKISSRGPVLYKQARVGKDGKVFTLYKFRTMVQDAEADEAKWAQKNDPRVTPVGRCFRKTRIDELPQIWNVLRGEMSFIGPRPERPDFTEKLERYIPFYEIRNIIKPGITGWAQVMYPYGASVEDAREKLQYDLYYIKNYSLMLDFWILIKTLRVVLGVKGR